MMRKEEEVADPFWGNQTDEVVIWDLEDQYSTIARAVIGTA
jgi:hypothetical protein